MKTYLGKTGFLTVCVSCFFSLLTGMYENETDVDSYLRLKESSSFKKVRTQKRKKQKKEYSGTIPTKIAFTEARQYLNHLLSKKNITLTDHDKERLLAITQGLIIKGSSPTDGTIESSSFRKIKKALKQHLKFLFPKEFSTKKELGKIFDLHIRLARKSIRATIKDYLEVNCAIKDPREIRRLWKSVKPAVEQKLEAASTINDAYEHVVSITKIEKIKLFAQEALKSNGIKPVTSPINQATVQPKDTKKVSPPSSKKASRWQNRKNRSLPRAKKRSPRKIEKAISLTTASQEVQAQLEHANLTTKERSRVHNIIMRRLLSQTTPHNRLLPSSIKQVMDQEILNAQATKKEFSQPKETPRSSSGARSSRRLRPPVTPMAIETE